MISVLKSPVFAFRSSPATTAPDTPTGSDFDSWEQKVEKKIRQLILEATSAKEVEGSPKPAPVVKIIGIADAGLTVFKVVFGDENLPSLDEVVGTRVAGLIGKDQFGFVTQDPDYFDKLRAERQRAEFMQLVADISATASQAGGAIVIPIWLSDPKPPVRHA